MEDLLKFIGICTLVWFGLKYLSYSYDKDKFENDRKNLDDKIDFLATTSARNSCEQMNLKTPESFDLFYKYFHLKLSENESRAIHLYRTEIADAVEQEWLLNQDQMDIEEIYGIQSVIEGMRRGLIEPSQEELMEIFTEIIEKAHAQDKLK